MNVAQRCVSQDQVHDGVWQDWARPDGFDAGAALPEWQMKAVMGSVAELPPAVPHRLALFGLPPVLAEPVTMLAEILGWQVDNVPAGQSACPPAHLCLALLPSGASRNGPIAAWSPEINLNERISRAGLSIMDQPLCITRVEQMLETLVCEP